MINWCEAYKEEHLILILDDYVIELMEGQLSQRGFAVHTFTTFDNPKHGVFIEEGL